MIPQLITKMTIIFATTNAFAALPKNLLIENALRQPLEQRIFLLQKEGLRGRHELQKIAFDQNEILENRWRAVTAIGRVYKKDSREILDKALSSPEWFMRNAALVVSPYVDRSWAIERAEGLLQDPALVVRTAAVQTLRQLNSTESKKILWKKLYSRENFRGKESLWIRRHILETLAQFAGPGQENQFIGVLNDKDASLHPIAMQTLEKLTREKFETTVQWQMWWENRKKI